jgi:hypothetical protein
VFPTVSSAIVCLIKTNTINSTIAIKSTTEDDSNSAFLLVEQKGEEVKLTKMNQTARAKAAAAPKDVGNHSEN